MTTFAPSALKATPVAGPLWAARERTGLPSAAFQNLTVLSSPAEATTSPRGLKTAWRTGPAWRPCQTSDRPQARAALSAPAEITRLPSPWKATASTGASWAKNSTSWPSRP